MAVISADQRALLAEILYSSGVYLLRETNNEEKYIAGETSPTLSELEIDSLAEIELCVSLEKHLGVSLSPDDIRGHETLNDLASRVFQQP